MIKSGGYVLTCDGVDGCRSRLILPGFLEPDANKFADKHRWTRNTAREDIPDILTEKNFSILAHTGGASVKELLQGYREKEMYLCPKCQAELACS